MGNKLKFPFLFKSTDNAAASPSPWPWPACVNTPKTLSFRATNIYNSAYLDHDKNCAETPDSFFSIRDSLDRDEIFISAAPEEEEAFSEETAVVLGLRSDRLFFEPGESNSNSILEEAKPSAFPYRESAKIVAMDSIDPFADFRASMEEMVAAHGLEDWQCLEELLTCYLRVNGKSNHGYIVGAFVDLLINLALASASPIDSSNSAIDEHCSSSSTATQCSFTSPLSFSSSSTYSSTSPCLSLPENEDDVVLRKKR